MKKLLAMLSIFGVLAAYGCAGETEDGDVDVSGDDTAVEDTTPVVDSSDTTAVADDAASTTDATTDATTTTTTDATTPAAE